MSFELNRKINDTELTKLIESLIESVLDQKLKEYDDVTRAITREADPTERAHLIEDLRGISTTIQDLLGELPDRNPTIHIVDGKVQ
jgi:hypothetical protein